jgi:hypothetical protein
MSKMDALRAMREAKYAANAKRSATATPRSAATKPAVAPAAPVSRKTAASSAAPAGSSADAPACGHRNMSGRTCTREAGHAAKSHRYS